MELGNRGSFKITFSVSRSDERIRGGGHGRDSRSCCPTRYGDRQDKPLGFVLSPSGFLNFDHGGFPLKAKHRDEDVGRSPFG